MTKRTQQDPAAEAVHMLTGMILQLLHITTGLSVSLSQHAKGCDDCSKNANLALFNSRIIHANMADFIHHCDFLTAEQKAELQREHSLAATDKDVEDAQALVSLWSQLRDAVESGEMTVTAVRKKIQGVQA